MNISLVLLIFFLLTPSAIAQPVSGAVKSITEVDGSPEVFPWQVKFTNGAVTDNADGTVTVSTSGSGDAITVNSSSATDPDFLDGDVDWTLTGGNSITATVGCSSCVALTTETSGNYVADMEASLPLGIERTASEGWTPLVKILQYTGTGNVVFNSSPTITDATMESSIDIPGGSSPTVDEADEIAIDTTDRGQFLWVSGSTVRSLPGTRSQCMFIENLAAADDNINISSYPYPVTIQTIWCECEGTCTTAAALSFEDDASNAMVGGTNPACATSTTVPTYVTVVSGGGLTARESWQFDVTNTPSPETDEYMICWEYVVDRQ